jgi:2-phospho-L-lactate guanylyltransferase
MLPVLCAIPLKPFAGGKERLGPAFGPEEREALARATAARVVAACRRAAASVAVVTRDRAVAAWAAGLGVPALAEADGSGLNGAAAAAAAAAAARGLAYAIVHADLPLLGAADVSAALGALGRHGAVLAPSRDGGTNLLAASVPIEFHYGPASFHHHLGAAAALRPRVVVRTGLCLDLDTPADVAAAARLRGGAWIADVVGNLS